MNQRRITIEDVAQAAGVSRQTVSRAINDQRGINPQTRKRVLEVAQRMGYRPSSIARGLARQRTRTLGLVMPNVDNPFFSSIARGVEELARANGYNVFLCDTTFRHKPVERLTMKGMVHDPERLQHTRMDQASAREALKPRETCPARSRLHFQSLPPQGKRYLVLWGGIVIFTSLMIIINAGVTTFLGVLGVSVLFVIVVSALVGRMF